MIEPAIITVAITGSQPRKKDNPAVPMHPPEQIESTHEAFEAGAAIVHVHVRDAAEEPSSDPDRFAEVLHGVRKHCPGMIVQFSTGGRGRTHEERGVPLKFRPDMASLATGSVNFATIVYENPPDVIDDLARKMLDLGIKPEVEVFDLAMIYNAADLVARGLLKRPVHLQFVLGIRNALPASEPTLDVLLQELRRVMPDATWSALGTSRHQLEVNRWALARGGHPRTGFEDNIFRSKGVLAQSNAELVGMTAALCDGLGRRPASVAEARRILGLSAAAPA